MNMDKTVSLPHQPDKRTVGKKVTFSPLIFFNSFSASSVDW